MLSLDSAVGNALPKERARGPQRLGPMNDLTSVAPEASRRGACEQARPSIPVASSNADRIVATAAAECRRVRTSDEKGSRLPTGERSERPPISWRGIKERGFASTRTEWSGQVGQGGKRRLSCEVPKNHRMTAVYQSIPERGRVLQIEISLLCDVKSTRVAT